MKELEPERIVRLEEDRVVLLDQRRLPDEQVELECRSADEVAEAIRTLAVRGAPAIGIAAARPTAVNLAWALQEVRAAPDPAERARAIHREEVDRCRRMALHAAELIGPGSSALTHCNTGGLATGGYGTALGAVRAAHEQGRVVHVWVGETRPLLQGARLTAWELAALGIPSTVIVDGAAGGLMATGQVDCVVVGADRIATNGDTANKVGTYPLAVLAAHHGLPFYVVAPTSTIDPDTPSGEEIVIEERAAAEVTPRFPARNPAFDVTPAVLVTAIVTEVGVHRAPYVESLPAPAKDAR